VHFTVCGGCNIDRQLRLTSPPQQGRTNPASVRERLGGGATNIACQLADWGAAVRLVSAQPPDSLVAMEARLVKAGIEAWLAAVDGDPPGYTALLDLDGELLMGAAAMALYETVSASAIRPGLVTASGPIILDANFPADTIAAIATEFGAARPLFAAGTSIAKVERLTAMLPLLDGLVLNAGEASALLGMAMPVGEMALALAERTGDSGAVLVSDGAELAALASGGTAVTSQPRRVQLVNADGAGDVMAARLFFDLACHPDMAPAARLQAALAAGADYAAAAQTET